MYTIEYSHKKEQTHIHMRPDGILLFRTIWMDLEGEQSLPSYTRSRILSLHPKEILIV